MARLPIPGGDDSTWGEVLNNFLHIEHNSDGTQKTLPVRKGGTGATDILTARANLGISSTIPLYIQHTNPGSSHPHLWIQTGLGPSGTDMTFWIEDGKMDLRTSAI
ncbi:hypothetical protein COU91_02685 [Candidatus Saccharibacteria bacterium CG10_big_fil_rev_8_21_14_0_10_47_8]|nr:MAG: hypothetical protein COU91_02685 [Candidatus Saccharibacteria bacterium CG10_big_fil_rev_8_21_14_0_10_47_8]